MKSAFWISLRIWLISATLFALGITTISALMGGLLSPVYFPAVLIAALILSFPCNAVFVPTLLILSNAAIVMEMRLLWLFTIQITLSAVYGGLISAVLFGWDAQNPAVFTQPFALITAGVFSALAIATALVLTSVRNYLSQQNKIPTAKASSIHHIKKPSQMQTSQPSNQGSQRILIKGVITGVLILLMLIPGIFIQNLIQEREQRQEEVVQEVSSKWALPQTLAGPFITVPYHYDTEDENGKMVSAKTNLIIFPQSLQGETRLFPEQRTRSIYKVLLYKSETNVDGAFNITLPSEIDLTHIHFDEARLCLALSDFMGIEEEITIDFNGREHLLHPGLPVTTFGPAGLSAPVQLTAEDLQKPRTFHFVVGLKGSKQFHLMPLSSAASFSISSSWPSPSFDGKLLPSQRTVSEKGFQASWNVNRANLPFGMVIREGTRIDPSIAFGVSLVQPASQYDKTSRSAKYTILFVGLTFAFFFIIELMQRRPFHPVQYVLVGLGLVIFYALLLSISEYISFNLAYLIAALATISLISLYAKSHFSSWKTAGIFFCLLAGLYGFIYVLISLEDTALIVGSIALFLILALAMYASRKINWYGTDNRLRKDSEF